jgi:hypothetical protein
MKNTNFESIALTNLQFVQGGCKKAKCCCPTIINNNNTVAAPPPAPIVSSGPSVATDVSISGY